jgi:hypothetical protein
MSTVQSPRRPQGLMPSVNSGAACAVGKQGPSTHIVVAAFLAVSACVSLVACASTAPYNPNRLSADEVSQVAEVCQTVMGFQPAEALTDNLWPGNPDPAASTNRYRGCIATLSSSLNHAAAARASRQAEQDCHSKGFESGSFDLALCVLTAEEAPEPSTPIRLASISDKPFLTPTKPSYSSHVPSTVRKEQLACAEIGLDPNEDAFAVCVQNLKSVAWTPFFEEGYRN